LLISLGTDSDDKVQGQDKKQPRQNEADSPLEGLFANLKR
jgi:hypothetical protein